MRRLYLLRHAKSDWADDQLDDHERPLAPRGERAALAIGEYLRQQQVSPARVLASSATRAVETWRLVATRLDRPVEAEATRALYLCGAGRLLAAAQACDDAAESLLIVAHNPDLQRLAMVLAGADWAGVPPEQAKFPTGALACIELADGGWASLSGGAARLAWLVTPKSLV